MAQEGSRITSWLRGQVQSAHGFLEATMKDVNADTDFDRPMNLSVVGIRTQSLGFVVNNGVVFHAFSHRGEFSALRGVQGKWGYPF